MKKKRQLIPNKKERVLLSDILPYEVPSAFSNRAFYGFLTENQIEVIGDKIRWKKLDDPNNGVLAEFVRLIWGFKSDEPILEETEMEGQHCYFKYDAKKHKRTIPFNFRISHKDSDYRELTIIHPRNQICLVEFYNKYRELIIYYCKGSPFSIRKPHKVAKFSYHKDRSHFKDLAHDHEHSSAEEFDKEYENLKTFFAYKDMSNIHKFYESYRFHRCEKKFDRLVKIDISKCFDSIYTHSIAWAIYNKGIVKDCLGKAKDTFAGKFDAEMQCLNYAETNGIVIGPEVSRIFAELILQKIDNQVLKELKENNLTHKIDYEAFRYVDDYFVFCNEKSVGEKIVATFRLNLKEFNLHINDSKLAEFEKPIVTGITRAKLRVSSLMNEFLDIKAINSELTDGPENDHQETKYSFYFSSNKLITRTKAIVKETDIAYADILNYIFACIDRKILRLTKIYSRLEGKQKYESKAIDYILELLDYVFFLYSVSPRVNSTIKLCMILSKLIKLTKVKGNFNSDGSQLVLKKIYDEILDVIKKNKRKKHTQVETLYLLTVLKELGKDYRLSEEDLLDYFDIKPETKGHDLNYFSIVILLFYIEGKVRYSSIVKTLKKIIFEKIESVRAENRRNTTELILLLLDMLSCPYLDDIYKLALIDLFEVDAASKAGMLKLSSEWFIKWNNFDFGKSLEAKRSQEVY